MDSLQLTLCLKQIEILGLLWILIIIIFSFRCSVNLLVYLIYFANVVDYNLDRLDV